MRLDDDKCIACDRKRSCGFPKVSVEELIIALRDDRHLLNDPGGLLAANYGVEGALEESAQAWGDRMPKAGHRGSADCSR
jgi:hypothetical protein